jgi:hypothetical protein
MQYPHWLMVAGAVLVVVGFVGLALHKNSAEPLENNLKQAAPPTLLSFQDLGPGSVDLPETPGHCKLGHAVQIEPGLRPGSPENGNISNICRRLSTISLPQRPVSEPGD